MTSCMLLIRPHRSVNEDELTLGLKPDISYKTRFAAELEDMMSTAACFADSTVDETFCSIIKIEARVELLTLSWYLSFHFVVREYHRVTALKNLRINNCDL